MARNILVVFEAMLVWSKEGWPCIKAYQIARKTIQVDSTVEQYVTLTSLVRIR